MSKKRSPISFRLSYDLEEELLERAANEGITPHAMAKRIVENALSSGSEIAKLRMTHKSLEGEVRELRADLTTATEALLVASGRVEPKQAKRWINENLKRR